MSLDVVGSCESKVAYGATVHSWLLRVLLLSWGWTSCGGLCISDITAIFRRFSPFPGEAVIWPLGRCCCRRNGQHSVVSPGV